MRLKYAKIVNFRSIEEVRIDFNPSCRTLVGINESGKSNILRALATISPEYPTTVEDIREPLPKERPIEQSYVWFVFELNKLEQGKIYAAIKPKLLSKKSSAPLLLTGSKRLDLESFCATRTEGLYDVDVKDQTRGGSYWEIQSSYSVLPNWKKPSSSCPSEFTVEMNGVHAPLKDFLCINITDFPAIPIEYLEPLTPLDVSSLVGEHIRKLVESSRPKVVFWKYDEKNLLPPSINMDEFVANPDSCIPLKNMFTLAGIKDISSELNAARTASTTKVRNLLKRVATHTTTHFRSVWKEHREISFALEPNGATIDAGVLEKNHWKMSQRSDGVKRFITFLLYISANIKSDLLKDSLLLVDEPDMGLHPSGSRFLRDELIESGRKNYVVFSTHSIFMIDKENVGRHIIVKKDSEKTTATAATNSNIVDEEVLFNALNYSVFDVLKKDNLIFEGWRDKKLFEAAMYRIPSKYASALKALKGKLKDLGLCHADGVKDIRHITPLLELANRNCVIISDADKMAKEKQKEFSEIKGHGVWKRYDEVVAGSRAVTGEDFLTDAAFAAGVSKLKKAYPVLTGDPAKINRGRMDEIKRWLGLQGIIGDPAKEIPNKLKSYLFDRILPSDVDDSYYEYLVALSPLVIRTTR